MARDGWQNCGELKGRIILMNTRNTVYSGVSELMAVSKRYVALSCTLILMACGGSSSDSDPTEVAVPEPAPEPSIAPAPD